METKKFKYSELSVEAKEQAHINAVTPEFFAWGVERAKNGATEVFEDYTRAVAHNEEDAEVAALIKATSVNLYCDAGEWVAELNTELSESTEAYQALQAKAKATEQIAADLEEQYASIEAWEEYDQHRDTHLYTEDGETIERIG